MQMPAWKFLDPIVILTAIEEDDGDPDDDDSIEAILEGRVEANAEPELSDGDSIAADSSREGRTTL